MTALTLPLLFVIREKKESEKSFSKTNPRWKTNGIQRKIAEPLVHEHFKMQKQLLCSDYWVFDEIFQSCKLDN